MTLIGGIYEAALMPECWPMALQAISDHLSVEGCTLITIDSSLQWVASTRLEDGCRDYIESGWHARNEPLDRLLKRRIHGFVREIDIFSPAEIETVEIIRDYKRPVGFGWSAAMATPVPSGEMLLFSVEQLFDRGPLSEGVMANLELLRPHLSRAALLAAKLQHQRDEAAVQSLGLIGVAAASRRPSSPCEASFSPPTTHFCRMTAFRFRPITGCGSSRLPRLNSWMRRSSDWRPTLCLLRRCRSPCRLQKTRLPSCCMSCRSRAVPATFSVPRPFW